MYARWPSMNRVHVPPAPLLCSLCNVQEGDVSLLAAWLGDLTVLGYDLPALQGGKENMTTCTRVNC